MKNAVLLIFCTILITPIQSQTMKQIDFQGHRGSRGILPENTVPAFLKALEFPIKTLEMDAAISKDGLVIISHDPWFNPEICTAPEGSDIKDLRKTYIKDLTYEEIKQFDCGTKGNQGFKDQKPMQVHKPSLSDVVEAVNNYCKQNNLESPHYNIEIKSSPDWDEITYPVEEFARILIEEINSLGITEKACIQSFDVRALKAAHQIDPEITLAYLIGSMGSPESQMNKLDFIPAIYSPYFKLVNNNLVRFCAEKEMQLIPWTVNEVDEMVKLIKLGVDGIITDYPNKIEEVKALLE